MTTLWIRSALDKGTGYLLEVAVIDLKDEHKVLVEVLKPITRPKVVDAVRAALASIPSSGSSLRTGYLEGMIVEV